MDAQTAFKLVEELRLQCRFAAVAWQNLRSNLQAYDAERSFFFANALLQHTREVARLLWPDRESSRERGQWLRKELQVPDDSPLRLRELRPHLERTDEQFEDWLASLPAKNFVSLNLMPMTALAGSPADAFHRSFDPDTNILTWRGVSCDLQKVAEAVRALDRSMEGWLRTHKPW